MDQELTVSKSIVNYLFKNLPAYKANNAQKCIDIIEQNYFVSDIQNSHLKKIYDEFKFFPDGDKKRSIFDLLDHTIQKKLKSIEYFYTEEEDCEIQLSNESEDKIFLDVNLDLKGIKSKTKKFLNVEFLNSDLIINPEISNRFRVIPTNYELQKDVRFDLVNFMRPFFRNATEIIIIDPFLANKYAFHNLKNLFQVIEKKCKIKLKLYSERDYLSYSKLKKDEFKNNYDILIKEINEQRNIGFKIEIEEFKVKKHKERYILTDKFEISIPGGLDCLDVNGFPFLDSDTEKKKFTVNFLSK